MVYGKYTYTSWVKKNKRTGATTWDLDVLDAFFETGYDGDISINCHNTDSIIFHLSSIMPIVSCSIRFEISIRFKIQIQYVGLSEKIAYAQIH